MVWPPRLPSVWALPQTLPPPLSSVEQAALSFLGSPYVLPEGTLTPQWGVTLLCCDSLAVF